MLGLGLTKFIPYLVYYGSIVFIFVSLIKPKMGIYFLVPLLPFRNVLDRIEIFPFGKDINDLLFLSIILGCFINRKILTKSPLNKYVIFLMVFSFLSYLSGSFFWGLENSFDIRDVRFIHWKNYAMLPVLYLMTVYLIKTKKEIMIMVFLIIMAIFVADYHYYGIMKYRPLIHYRDDLLGGFIFTNLNKNVLAAFFAHFIFLPLGLLFHHRQNILKIFYAGVVTFTLYPIAFLFSRGAYIGLFFGLLFVGIVRKSKMILFVLMIILLFWTTLLPSAVVERIEMTHTDEGYDSSSMLRLDYWAIGLKQFVRSPLIGVGFDTSKQFRRGDLHNIYIEMLAEQGIIGLWILLSLLIITYRNGIWIYKNSNDDFIKGFGLAVVGVVVACAVTNFFGDRWTYMEISAFFFVLMALAVNARNLIKN